MKYVDYSLIRGLNNLRSRHDFPLFAEDETGLLVDDTPQNRIQILTMMEEKIKENGVSFIEDLESRLIPVLAKMEVQGVYLDTRKLEDIGTRIRRDIKDCENKIFAISPQTFNISSPRQIQEIFVQLGIKLTKKNKTGYSVDVDVLEEIAKEYPIARYILDYRTLTKLESTYVSALLKSVDTYTKRIHTTYDSLGASTGRMSSNDPNLQNIPAGDGYAYEIKSCFTVTGDTDKRIMLVADYSQIELRVLAFLSQDAGLLDAFEHGEDIHMRTARFLFPDKQSIGSKERRIAKSVNFGVIYGITGFGLSKTLDCSPWEANAYIDAFYTRYPMVRKYYDSLLDSGRELGYVATYFGRKRIIPGLSDANKTIRAISEREAMNMPIQGTAADMLKIAMIDIDSQIMTQGLSGSMILQVHDELVFDIPQYEKDAFETLVRTSMEGVLQKNQRPDDSKLSRLPPILVDIHTGNNWAEAKG